MTLDGLTPAQRAQVVRVIRDGVPYVDIANDWLISVGSVGRIAREEGVQRRPRRKAGALSPEARL